MRDVTRAAVRPARAPRTLGIGLAFLLAAALPVRSATPPVPTPFLVDVERDGDRFRVTARADLLADPRVAWDTLTDYERLPAFVPSVSRARVLAREVRPGGERLTVEYQGTLTIWWFGLPTRVWLDVEHRHFTDITARASATIPARGGGPPPSLKSFDGRYTLTALEGAGVGAPRVRLDYSAQFELAEPLPPIIGPLFGTAAVRQTLREQFGATVTEIERRSSARQGARQGR
jgi:hypothetical protein